MPDIQPQLGPVAYLTSEYPKVSHTFIQREAEGLRAAGLNVTTCSIRKPRPGDLTGPEEEAAYGETFYVLDTAKNPLRLIRDHLGALTANPGRYFRALRLAFSTRPPGLKALLWQLFYFAEAGVLARHLARRNVTHLHTHFANSGCSVAMLTSEMSAIPFSFMMHGPSEFFEAEHWRLDEKVARARFVTCISHFCRSQLMIFSDQAHWGKLHILHCALEPGFYDHPRPAPGKRLLFVGRMAGVKGVPVLLEAMQSLREHHPDVRLTLVGGGPELAGLEARASDLGVSDLVEFVGYKSQSEVAAYLSQSDVFVLPSFAEGLPVVLMEALASRVPVVTTRIAGVAELVEDGVSGYLVPPGDIDSLAARISALLEDPALRRRMGEAGRTRVIGEFNISTECARLAHLMATYQGGRPPSGTRAPLPD